MCNTDKDEDCQKVLQEYLSVAGRKDLPPEFYIEIAKAYALNGDIDNSLQNCKMAVQMKSEDTEAYQLLGLIALLKGDLEEAKNNLTIALHFQPDNQDTHNIFSYVFPLDFISKTFVY